MMRRFRNLFLFCFLSVLAASPAWAAIESYDFQDEEQRLRYQQLAEELRCPKCQNQNLADSDSQIAADLRKELHDQLLAGKSDEAIVDFMRERYGDFVLYKPRLQRNTLALWLGPLGLILLVSAWLVWARRPTAVQAQETVPAHDIARERQPVLPPASRLVSVVSLVVLISVAAGSLALYRHLGALQALQITEMSRAVFSGQLPPEQAAHQQAQLLVELDDWLSAHPAQEQFQYMRARLLAESGQWERAVTDFSDLVTRFPEQDNLLAEYAQVLFLQNQRVLGDEAESLLQRALAVNPLNVTALGLLGMQAFEKADYTHAVGYWQRLLRTLPPGSAQAGTIQAGIDRARTLGNLPVDTVAAGSDIRFQVQVVIADDAKAIASEPVFVFLRAVNGPRMPLAAVRTTVAALAQSVLLDTATSPMAGQLDLASIEQFEVVARLSRSGQPQAAAGDWEGVITQQSRQQLSTQIPLSVTINKAISP